MELEQLTAQLKAKFGPNIILDTPRIAKREINRSATASSPKEAQSVPYQDTLLPPPDSSSVMDDPNIPLKIREMMKLYEFGDGSIQQRRKNFYRQGKFMEDYEDHKLYDGNYRHYFTTYHDLNPDQLRGYFGWRSLVRKGTFVPIATSLAFIYVYELLNCIGATSPEDALEKLRAFKVGYIESGVGKPSMKKYLDKWMLEFAVVHDLPTDSVREMMDQEMLEMDESLLVLKNPTLHSSEEVYRALLELSGKSASESTAVKKKGDAAIALFAEAWREAVKRIEASGGDLFKQCFGKERQYVWRPLANAVVWERAPHPDCEYQVDACRKFICKNGAWTQLCYANFHFDRKTFRSFYRGVDRLLRAHFKTGGYLKENPDEKWVKPIVQGAFKAVERQKIEAARQKVSIDVSNLARIRDDADVTRDSLLTEEELGEEQASKSVSEVAFDGASNDSTIDDSAIDDLAIDDVPLDQDDPAIANLDPVQILILQSLLEGSSVSQIIKDRHLMASVLADSINEALFDEVGDNVLETDGNNILLVEDYIDDVAAMIGVPNE